MPKTIDDIIPPSRRRQMTTEPPAPTYPSTETSQTPPPMPPENTHIKIRSGRNFPYGTAIIALVVILICAGVLYAFSNAEVRITPTSQAVSVSAGFTATQGTGDLPYTTISLNSDVSKAVPAESTQTANDSAQGTIVITNTGSKTENFVTNTRFQSESGLIYRVHTPISIPAASVNGPGTLTATIYADQPGQQYNIGPTTFTVPGLKGSNAFSEVTAKSTGNMIGGFTGTRAAVSQATDDSAHAALKNSLATTLQSQLQAKIPSGYVVVPGASTITYTDVPDTASTTSSVLITEQGTLNAVAFPEDAFAKAVAYSVVGTYAGEPVTLDSVAHLTLTPSTSSSTPVQVTGSTTVPTYQFNLSGNTTVIWKVDATRIAGAVAGKTRDSAQSILAGFPEVSKAVLVLRPFWASAFPQDPTHIKVVVEKPAGS